MKQRLTAALSQSTTLQNVSGRPTPESDPQDVDSSDDDNQSDNDNNAEETSSSPLMTPSAVERATAAAAKKPSSSAVPLIVLNTAKCRYAVVRQAAVEMGFVLEEEGRWSTSSESRQSTPPPTTSSSSANVTNNNEALWFQEHTLRSEMIVLPNASSSSSSSVTAAVRRAETKLKKRYALRYDPSLGPQLHWVDTSVLVPRVAQLKCFHRLNHFPNMNVICRKMIFFSRCMKLQAFLASRCEVREGGGAVVNGTVAQRKSSSGAPLSSSSSAIAKAYEFIPQSFSLKTDGKALDDFLLSLKRHKRSRTFLMKPNTGCQGKGIILTKHPWKTAKEMPDDDVIVQVYVHRPLLIDGKKFDMRVYVLITMIDHSAVNSSGASSSPPPPPPSSSSSSASSSLAESLQIYVHREGLVRICSERYQKPRPSNFHEVHRHLTNYALNKNHQDFVGGGGGGGGGKEDRGHPHHHHNNNHAPPSGKRLLQETPEVPFDFSDNDDDDNDGEQDDHHHDGGGENKRDFHFLKQFLNAKEFQSAPLQSDGGGEGGGTVRSSSGTSKTGPPSGGRGTTTAALRSTTKGNEQEEEEGEEDEDEQGDEDDDDAHGDGDNPATKETPWQQLCRRVDSVVVLSILSGVLDVRQALHAAGGLSGPRKDGRSCFELLGFDLMVTESGRVYILEINHSPSLTCDAAIDVRIKKRVLKDTFRIVAGSDSVPDVSRCSDVGYQKTAQKEAKRWSKHTNSWMLQKAEKEEEGEAGRIATTSPPLTLFRQAYPLPRDWSDVENSTRNASKCYVEYGPPPPSHHNKGALWGRNMKTMQLYDDVLSHIRCWNPNSTVANNSMGSQGSSSSSRNAAARSSSGSAVAARRSSSSVSSTPSNSAQKTPSPPPTVGSSTKLHRADSGRPALPPITPPSAKR